MSNQDVTTLSVEDVLAALDFQATVKVLLQTPPPPADTQGSRRAVKPKARKWARKEAKKR